MFVRFSKRNNNPERIYRRATAINNTFLVQEGNNIIAYGKLNHNYNREYKIWVVDCDHTCEIERYVKRFIGNSIKWENPTIKHIRRKYKVLYIGQDKLNQIKFEITWK